MKEFDSTLTDFIVSRSNRAWLEHYPVVAYFRKGYRLLAGDVVDILELANVGVGPSDTERTGLLRPIFLAMEAQTVFDWLYIENCNRRMQEICRKNGYIEIVNSDGLCDPCFYKKIR